LNRNKQEQQKGEKQQQAYRPPHPLLLLLIPQTHVCKSLVKERKNQKTKKDPEIAETLEHPKLLLGVYICMNLYFSQKRHVIDYDCKTSLEEEW